MTTIELDEHLDPKNWTRRTLITHLDNPNAGECHGNYYYGSDTTKRSMVDSHREKHEREIARAARLVTLADTIAYLRTTFGCRLAEGSFATADDAWITQHIANHKSGHLGDRLL